MFLYIKRTQEIICTLAIKTCSVKKNKKKVHANASEDHKKKWRQVRFYITFLFLIFMPILQVFFSFFFLLLMTYRFFWAWTWSCNMYKNKTNVCYQKTVPFVLTLLLNVTNGTGFYHQQPFEHWVYYHNDTSAYHLLE